MAKKFLLNEQEAKELLKSIAGTLVRARMVQHLCWEMQHDMINIRNKTFARGLIVTQNSIFNKARDIMDMLGVVYYKLPDNIKSKDQIHSCSSDYMHHLYDSMSDFYELDNYSDEQLIKMFAKIANVESNSEDQKN